MYCADESAQWLHDFCLSNASCLTTGVRIQIIEPLGVIDYAGKLIVDGFQISLGISLWGIHQLVLPSSHIGSLNLVYRLIAEKRENMCLADMLLGHDGGLLQSWCHIFHIKFVEILKSHIWVS